MSFQSTKVYKRYSSITPSSHIMGEVQEGQPGKSKTEVSAVDRVNGVQTSSEVQRSTLVFGRPSTIISSPTTVAPKVQLRTQRTRQVCRPVSMPLERLPTPAQIGEKNNGNTADAVDSGSVKRDTITETIQEMPEPEKARQSGSSRVSTYYITPFIDTQRRTWDKKYKHYDVTPRTAMIMANLPSASPGVQPVKAIIPVSNVTTGTTASVVPTTSSVSAIFSSNLHTAALKSVWTSKRENDIQSSLRESSSSSNLSLTLRAPRTLQPPPGTFYKPPNSYSSRAATLTNWTTALTTTSTTTTTTISSPALTTTITSSSAPTSPVQVVSTSPVLTSPTQRLLQTQDSTDSAIDSGVSTSAPVSPPQSPPPSSPDDLSPSENKPVYQRLRPRRLQELEIREAHFV